MEYLLSQMHLLFIAIGPWGVVCMGFLQEVIPPIPSPLVTVSAGFFFLEGTPLSWAAFLKLLLYVGLPIAGGLSAGALIIYGIVYWGGKSVVVRYGKYLGVSWDEVEKTRSYIDGHTWDDFLLFGARALPFIPSTAINVFAGLVRWRPLSFFLLTFFGTIVRAMISGFVGWQFGNFYLQYSTVIDNAENTIFVVFVVFVCVFLYYHKKRKEKQRSAQETSKVVE